MHVVYVNVARAADTVTYGLFLKVVCVNSVESKYFVVVKMQVRRSAAHIPVAHFPADPPQL